MTILFNWFKFYGVFPKFHLSIRKAVIFSIPAALFYVLHHEKYLMFKVKCRKGPRIYKQSLILSRKCGQMMKTLSPTILFKSFRFYGFFPKFHISFRIALTFLHITCIFLCLHHEKYVMFKVQCRKWPRIQKLSLILSRKCG